MNFNQWMDSIDLQIGNPHFAWLMAFALVAVAVSIWAGILRKRALKTFGTTGLERGNRSTFSRLVSTLALVLSIVLLSLALMDVRWGKTTYEVPQKGLEVVFALDVSRSMLAQDASPSRLERAKQQIKDMVDEMAGDRVGLVVFAGEADQTVPLTSHYDDFKQILDTVGPHSISVGGSQLGGAIKAASEAFISKTNEHKTIVLFTDGEDQESEPVKLAKQLHADEGVRVFTVGLGDFEQGARIPDEQSRSPSFVQHEGQQVWSKLNGRILKEIATETEGAYIPAGTKRVNMADVYHGYVAKVEQTEFETAKINAYVPRFQWFAGAALFFLLIEVWLTSGGNRKRAARNHQSNSSSSSRRGATTSIAPTAKAAAAIAFLLLLPANGVAQQTGSTASKINAANELVRQQKTTEAIDAYNQIDLVAEAGSQSQLDYNLAVAHYRNSDSAAAITLFGEASKSLDREIAASSRHNLGNCHYAQALPLVESEPEAAVEQLEKSIVHYRSALRLDRSNADSRSNIELARKLIKQIQDQKEQEDSKQEQQQQSQDPDNESEQNESEQDKSEQDEQDSQQDSQNNQSSESQDSQNQQNEQQQDSSQDAANQNNSSESQEPDKDSESKSESESKGESGDKSDQPPESGNEQTGEQTDNQRNQTNPRQSDSNEPGKPEDSQQADTADEQSADKSKQPNPEQMAGELTADNQSNAKEGDESAARLTKTGDGLMTREEALKMLQSVRDRDMLRRLQQQRRQRIRRVPVDKDW